MNNRPIQQNIIQLAQPEQVDIIIHREQKIYTSSNCIICTRDFDDPSIFPVAKPCSHQVICTKCIIENHRNFFRCSVCRTPIRKFIFN